MNVFQRTINNLFNKNQADASRYADDSRKQEAINAKQLNDYLIRIDALKHLCDSSNQELETGSENFIEFSQERNKLDKVMLRARQIKNDKKEYPQNYFKEMDLILANAKRAIENLWLAELNSAIEALERGFILREVPLSKFEAEFEIFIAYSVISQELFLTLSYSQAIQELEEQQAEGNLSESNKKLLEFHITDLSNRKLKVLDHISEIRMNLTRMKNDTFFDTDEMLKKREELDRSINKFFEKTRSEILRIINCGKKHEDEKMDFINSSSSLWSSNTYGSNWNKEATYSESAKAKRDKENIQATDFKATRPEKEMLENRNEVKNG